MKKVFSLLIFSLCLGCFCQVYGQSGNEKFRQHTGFYLSMSAGPAFGKITLDETRPYVESFEFSGTGGQLDIKIGGAVKENLILHATMISTVLPGPKIKSSSHSGRASDDMSIDENMLLGGGLTYYIMPANIFLSGSAGMGKYSFTYDNNSQNDISTNSGLSIQLKAGKEWWIGKRWGLGFAFTYGKTNLTNKGTDYDEKLNSNRFSILFNATFN